MEDTTPATTAFLAAEDAAAKLVQSLSRLEDESKRYGAAAETLNRSGEALTSLANAVREVGVHAAEAVDALRAVGGPAVLDGIVRVQLSLDRGLADLQDARGKDAAIIRGALDSLRTAMTTTSNQQTSWLRLMALFTVIIGMIAAVVLVKVW